MAEQDAMAGAKFSNGIFLKDFPVKLRVLTLDPMCYADAKYGSTHYVFVVYNLDEEKCQVWDTSPGNASRLQEIHLDPDFGNNLRGIDIKVTTNGKAGKERRYTISTVGSPHELTQDQVRVIYQAGIDLEKVVKKNNPQALRLSEVNAGAKIPTGSGNSELNDGDDVVINDIGDEPINLDDIPF